MNDYDPVFRKVENAACECASIAMGGSITAEEIYSGRTKPTLGVSIARQLAFMFMHDHYGISYRRIAGRSQMTIGAVMKCVGKARRYKFSDPIYNLVHNLMDEKL